MWKWYLTSSSFERLMLALLLCAFSYVMFRSWQSLSGTHQHVTWYRGIYSTPVFQVLMWLGAGVLILPYIYLRYQRSKRIRTSPLIGNSKTRIYHSRYCEYQIRISNDIFRVPFNNHNEALSYGFRPCNWGCCD